MKLLISTPIRFHTTPDGAVWVKQKSDSFTFWVRYLVAFDTVTVLGRVHPVATAPAGWLRADGAGVIFVLVPDFVGPYQLMRKWFSVWRAVRAAARGAEAVLLRVPCNIGTMLWISLARGRPYGVEVVADPYGALAPGVLNDRLRPVWRWLLPYYLRRICDEATTAAYVTRYALQRLYPPRNNIFSTSYSDVVTTYYSSINLQPQVVTNAPRVYATNQHAHTVICVGAMEVLSKAQDILIEACALCTRRGMDLHLILIGDGKMRKSLEVLAGEVGMAVRVTFAGQLANESQITRALDNADLFALPSRTEGLPRAMIEAMARGLPCIGSDVGGIPELIPSDSLVPADDAPALAAKIFEVLTDSARMARMSKENLARVAEYSEDVLRDRRQAFYRHLAAETLKWNNNGLLPTGPDNRFEMKRIGQ
jgi:glycosyltransferase involved in cell wall biosynthesis